MSRLNLILKMPDHPAVKATVKHKKRPTIEEAFEKNHEIAEDLKSADNDVEELEDDDSEENNSKKTNVASNKDKQPNDKYSLEV